MRDRLTPAQIARRLGETLAKDVRDAMFNRGDAAALAVAQGAIEDLVIRRGADFAVLVVDAAIVAANKADWNGAARLLVHLNRGV